MGESTSEAENVHNALLGATELDSRALDGSYGYSSKALVRSDHQFCFYLSDLHNTYAWFQDVLIQSFPLEVFHPSVAVS